MVCRHVPPVIGESCTPQAAVDPFPFESDAHAPIPPFHSLLGREAIGT